VELCLGRVHQSWWWRAVKPAFLSSSPLILIFHGLSSFIFLSIPSGPHSCVRPSWFLSHLSAPLTHVCVLSTSWRLSGSFAVGHSTHDGTRGRLLHRSSRIDFGCPF
jgi:hypothetical protein